MALVGDSYEYYDKRFYQMTVPIAELEELYSGCRWAEGPVWFNDGQYLVWSDIPNNRKLRWMPELGVSVFNPDSNFSNGMTRDRQGRLISCEHGKRRVTRLEPDGKVTVIADRHAGKRLNSPNDVVVKSDGTIWFTDPDYGIMSDYEGHKADREQKGCFVYRVDPKKGEIRIVADDFVKPNGLAFSPDGRTLYVGDSGANHELGTFDPRRPHHIRAFDVDGARLINDRLFAVITPGFPDGIKVDDGGRVYASAFSGVHVFDPDGELLAEIELPGAVNFTFGGRGRQTLYVTADTAVWAVPLPTKGA